MWFLTPTRVPPHSRAPPPGRYAPTPLATLAARSTRTSTTTYRDFKAIAQKPLYHLRTTFWIAVVFFGPLYLATFGANVGSTAGSDKTVLLNQVRRILSSLVAQVHTSYLTYAYITVEYLSAVACAAFEYEHAYTKAGLQIRTGKYSENSAKSEDDGARRDRTTSRANFLQETQILQSYREHYLDARNAIAKQNSYYGLPIGFMMVILVTMMVYNFVVMFRTGVIAKGFGGLLRGLPIFAVVFPTAYANFKIDSFATYILEDSAYTFEFAIKYSACE